MQPPSGAEPPLLEVDGLIVKFFTRAGTVHAVNDVSFQVAAGEITALVGESGSGKTVTAETIMGLTSPPGRVVDGDVLWKGASLLHGAEARALVQRLRGREIALITQEPIAALNPVLTVGYQMREVMQHHLGLSRREARTRSLELLDMVGISAPERRLRQFAFELSGGMCQRVMIALALACRPQLLIADEPTTALDVTIQAQILELLRELNRQLGLAILMITHDLGVVANICDSVKVMYGGRLLEEGPAERLFAHPAHPYTVELLRSTPDITDVTDRLHAIPGAPPDLRSVPPGCPFEPRCGLAVAECVSSMPAYVESGREHRVACVRPFGIGAEVDHAGQADG